MRTTIDIPDGLYAELKTKAACDQTSVKALILRGVKSALEGSAKGVKQNRLKVPIVNSGARASVRISNDQIDELLFS